MRNILLFIIIIIIIYYYKIYIDKIAEKKKEGFNIFYNDPSPLELIGKHCNINMLSLMRDYCSPELLHYFKINRMRNAGHYTNWGVYNNILDSSNDFFFRKCGFLYKKGEDKRFGILPLYKKKHRGELYEYLIRVKINGQMHSIPISKSATKKNRELYNGDNIKIEEPINGEYTYYENDYVKYN